MKNLLFLIIILTIKLINSQENPKENPKETCILLCTYGCKGNFGASCCSKEAFEDNNCVICRYGGGCRQCRKGYVYDGKKCMFKYPKHKCNKVRDSFKGICRCVRPEDTYYCV